jgi:hypothetical protein
MHDAEQAKEDATDGSKRGPRESPRTPTDEGKLAKLQRISAKLSPGATVPPLPGLAQGSDDEPAGTKGTPVTMEAMTALLAKQLSPLTGSVSRLEADLKSFKTKVEDDIEGVKSRTDQIKQELKKDLEHVKMRISQVETRDVNEVLAHKIKTIEKEISNLKTSTAAGSVSGDTSNHASASIRFVGFDAGGDGEAEADWIAKELGRLKLEAPSDTYYKGESFKGQLFSKLPSAKAANAAMSAFNKQRRMFNGQAVKCKPDLPLEPRICLSSLLGLRCHLIQ